MGNRPPRPAAADAQGDEWAKAGLNLLSEEVRREECSAARPSKHGGRYRKGTGATQRLGGAGNLPLRLLCLHGRGSNSDVTEMQMLSLGLIESVECDFLEAPIAAAANEGLADLEAKCFSWLGDDAQAHDLELRVAGVLFCLETHGPFDGVYGFSQGGGVVACLSDPLWLTRLGRKQPPFRFAILGCAVDVRMEGLRGELAATPSLHLIGQHDKIRDQSEQLASTWAGSGTSASRHTTIHFDAGHEMPMSLQSDESLKTGIEAFLQRFVRYDVTEI